MNLAIKKVFGVVLLALVDNYYKFLYADVGCRDRISDVGVFPNCSLKSRLQGELKPHPDKGLDDRKRILNYRLSRFRRCSENAFGILVQVFGIFGTTIKLPQDKAMKIVLSVLRTKSYSYSEATNSLADESNNKT